MVDFAVPDGRKRVVGWGNHSPCSVFLAGNVPPALTGYLRAEICLKLTPRLVVRHRKITWGDDLENPRDNRCARLGSVPLSDFHGAMSGG